MEFYDLSKTFAELCVMFRDLDRTHLFRYFYLVKSSPKGRSCSLAQKTKVLHQTDGEATQILIKLRQARTTIDKLIKELE